MTLDEAIKQEKEITKQYEHLVVKYQSLKDYGNPKSSITDCAKSCKVCAEEHRQLAEWLKDYKRLLEQKPCDDAISREAVNNLQKYRYNCGDTSITCVSLKSINELPSVTQKAGKWIAQDIHNCHTDFKCSKCGYIHSFMHLYGKPTADYTYCPNCGARMVEPKESEDKE